MEDASLCTLLPTGPCIIAAAQYCCEGQSSFVRQAPPDAGMHVPSHVVVESTTHMEPFAHSTSSMQAPPSDTLPENATAHGSGMLQPRGYESWRHVRRHPWSPSVLRILRVHERSIASCRIALRKPQSRTELANRAIGSSASSPPEHYLA